MRQKKDHRLKFINTIEKKLHTEEKRKIPRKTEYRKGTKREERK